VANLIFDLHTLVTGSRYKIEGIFRGVFVFSLVAVLAVVEVVLPPVAQTEPVAVEVAVFVLISISPYE